MKTRLPYLIGCCSVALVAFTGAAYLTYQSSKDIPLGDERELKVNIEAGFGNLVISRGSSDHVVKVRAESDEQLNMDDCTEYQVRDKVGYLNFATDCDPNDANQPRRDKGKIHIDRLESRTWRMEFTDAVPIAFDMELGLGKGDIDMTGLAVKDFSLSCGASSVNLRFDKPNKEVIDDMNIEAGVSKFEAYGLANARFRHFRFSGGVGSYTLDFGGTLQREVNADIDVGLGTLTIRIPEEIGAKVIYEKSWIAHINFDNGFAESEEEDNSYFSQNYFSAKGRINLRIDAGMGSVKVRRSR